MNFEPHGRFDIQTQGQILRVQFWDSWNHEGVLQFFESYKAAILSLGVPRFGVLTDLRSISGATERAIEYADVVVSWAISHGQVCRAVLLNKAYERFLVRKITEDNDAIPTETFQDEDQAMDWLRTQTLQSAFNRATSPPDLSAHAPLPH